LALSLGLFALALPPSRPPAADCPAPRETATRGGHSLEVRCDGGAGGALRGPARLLFGLPIDPNRADARTLEVLPGIGPARAAAIVAERERRPFAHAADLERVAGIGPKTLRRMAPWLALPGGAAPSRNR
jgi:competence protein ComEA